MLPASLDDLKGRRAALWIRESTQGQWDAFGPDAQREQYVRAIERYGLVDTGIEWSVAHSGRSVGGTAQFSDMARRAGRDYEVLVVGYVSRFARDLRTAVNARHDLHASGAAILFADDRILSSDERAWDEWAREAVEAESYSRRLGRRISEGLESKWRRYADQAGQAPLGFRRRAERPKTLEPDPETIGKVVALFERYATGVPSIRVLADEVGMNEVTLKEILKNPIYNGWVRMKGELHEAAWRNNPPVSDALWAQVEAIRSSRILGGGPRRRDRVDALAGLLYCKCGQYIRADGASGQGLRRRHAKPCEFWQGPKIVSRAYYEDAIFAQLDGLTLDNATIAKIALLVATLPAQGEDQMRRPRIQKQIRDLALRHAEGRLPDQDYLDQSAALRAQLNVPQEPTGSDLPPDRVVEHLRAFSRKWRLARDENKQKLIKSIYERIVVTGKDFDRVVLTQEAKDMGMILALQESCLVSSVPERTLQRTSPIRIPVEGREAYERLAAEQSA